jgi:hypothetical protein
LSFFKATDLEHIHATQRNLIYLMSDAVSINKRSSLFIARLKCVFSVLLYFLHFVFGWYCYVMMPSILSRCQIDHFNIELHLSLHNNNLRAEKKWTAVLWFNDKRLLIYLLGLINVWYYSFFFICFFLKNN